MQAGKDKISKDKGSLMTSFRKVALLGVAVFGLAGCVTTGPYVSGTYPAGGQYGSPVYGQGSYHQGVPRAYQITYQPPRAPWANDPAFQQEVSINLQRANNTVRLQYANFQSRLAQCNANYTRALDANNRQMQNARRNGVSWTEAATSGARINAANATFNQCRVNAETGFQSSFLNQQQSFDRTIENLNRKYGRQYGVR
jgi:hypothetical protein